MDIYRKLDSVSLWLFRGFVCLAVLAIAIDFWAADWVDGLAKAGLVFVILVQNFIVGELMRRI